MNHKIVLYFRFFTNPCEDSTLGKEDAIIS